MAIKNKIIPFLLTASISMGGGIYISHRYNESKNKQFNEAVDKLVSDESYTEMVLESLKTSFNSDSRFEVMSGDLKINHTYKYKEDPITWNNIFTGKEETIFEPTIIKSGSAVVLFDYEIESLDDCEITVDNRKENGNKNVYTINILAPYPVLDESSVHRQKDSFQIDEANTSINFDAKMKLMGQSIYTKYKETMDARATRGLEDDIDRIMPEKISKIYQDDQDKIYELESSTVNSIYKLVNAILGDVLVNIDKNSEFEINVKMKESRLENEYSLHKKIENSNKEA